MTNTMNPDVYIGRNAVDAEGNKIGSVGQVYLNDETGEPDWITINTGLFGMKENFAPLNGASFSGDDLVLPYGKDVVKGSPDVADASHLDADEQQSLYSYYQQYVGGKGGTATDVANGGNDRRTSTDGAEHRDSDAARGDGRGASGPNTDDAMTRSEEQLRVSTERVESGRARLRKYVVTEQQTVTVPVSHEEVRLEREPITDANRDDALAGGIITEEEHEVVLHAERPVVTTEAVPVERVRLSTETVTEQESVTGEVRKEQVELEDPSTTGTGRQTS
ncbi:MAG: PRC and DUF2382 domain-containing protein [Nakamurella sp.]